MIQKTSQDLPRALIFDWDNTLVDSWAAIAEAMNHTRQTYGLNVWTLDEIKTNCTRAARESFPIWFGDNWKKAYDTYYKDFDEVRRRRDIKVLPGAKELLVWLHEQGIPSFVVSNKRGDYLRYEAEKLNWVGLFKAIIGAQDAPRDKPDRAHVDFALRNSGVTADASAWFIGDSETDVLCARNAGCTPVLIGHPAEAKRLNVALNFTDCQALQSLLYSRKNSRS